MSGYVRTDKQLVIAAMGIGTSVLTALVLGLIEVYTGYAIYSWTFWFVIPVGAFLAGFGAASGYYAGAMLFHQKPVGGVLFNMLSVSVSAYLIVHYVPYYLLEVNGIRVKDAISFWQYLDFAVRHTSLTLVRGGASTGELGGFWGYGYAGLQLLGFSVGGFAVFAWLTENPYCDKCSRYLGKTGKQERYTSDGDVLIATIKEFAQLLDAQNFHEAIGLHAKEMGVVEGPSHHLRSRIITRACSRCSVNHLDFVVSRLDRDTWKDISETQIKLFTHTQLSTVDQG